MSEGAIVEFIAALTGLLVAARLLIHELRDGDDLDGEA